MSQVAGLLLVALTSAFDPAGSETPIDVRIGIVAYQDSRAEVERFQRHLEELATGSPRPIEIRFAIGTYGDVMHWMDKKYIDLAVVSPGIFAETLNADTGKAGWRYLGALGLRPAQSPLAAENRRSPGYHYEYRSLCVVAAGSSLRSMADGHACGSSARLGPVLSRSVGSNEL